ncbi:MAG: hypothetical protein ACI8V2_003816 [Candidatus Latescibacterota bacterium]|jgi:hypothetical protein
MGKIKEGDQWKTISQVETKGFQLAGDAKNNQ